MEDLRQAQRTLLEELLAKTPKPRKNVFYKAYQENGIYKQFISIVVANPTTGTNDIVKIPVFKVLNILNTNFNPDLITPKDVKEDGTERFYIQGLNGSMVMEQAKIELVLDNAAAILNLLGTIHFKNLL